MPRRPLINRAPTAPFVVLRDLWGTPNVRGPASRVLVWSGTLLLVGLAGSDYVITFAILAVGQIGFLLFTSELTFLTDGERRFLASLKIAVEVTAIHR